MSSIGKLMKQAARMQQQMEQVQAGLAARTVEATSGGGAVIATMNGKKQLLKLRIDPSAVVGLSSGRPDVEMLEDLVVAAVNEAGRMRMQAPAAQLAPPRSSLRVAHFRSGERPGSST